MQRALLKSYAFTLLASFAVDMIIGSFLIYDAEDGQGRGYTVVIVMGSAVLYTLFFAITSLPVVFLSRLFTGHPVRRIMAYCLVPVMVVMIVLSTMKADSFQLIDAPIFYTPVVFLLVQIVCYRRLVGTGIFDQAKDGAI